jgi:glyoxylase-like metal-dependent hydrolase (beta-lactamase superfamily II)
VKVHHLNCGTMRLPGNNKLICHVLLLETDGGLVLVDSGYGLKDCADPARRVGPARFYIHPAFDPDESALRQIEALGFRREDVRHIILTHFDADHIGGLADFPDARVHATAAEVLGAITEPSWRERRRYRPAQWAHGPRIVEHTPDGERWNGFAAAKELTDIAPGIVLVSLPGHTRGHAAVAVDTGDRWLLHAGDAFYHYASLDGREHLVPKPMSRMETLVAFDLKQVRDNHARLAELHQRADPGLTVFNAHDPTLLERLSSATGTARAAQ